MENIRSVVKSFGIYPTDIELITDRLYQIRDHHNTFYALKKSSLTKQTISTWESVFHHANKKNLYHVVPVYLTNQGKLYLEEEGNIYYLSPWLTQSNEQPDIEKLYRALGYIHGSTKQSQEMDTKSILHYFRKYKKNCQTARSSLLHYVEQFEQKRYMSPFELLVCSQFHSLEHVYTSLERRIDNFLDELKNVNKWSVSLCHGNLGVDHVVQGNQIHLLNWEYAFYDNAVLDLVSLFNGRVINFDEETSNLVESFETYQEENTLEKAELYYLVIYLLDPSKYMNVIKDYVESPDSSIIELTKKLQQLYRQLTFGLEFSSYIESEYENESISLEDLES